MKKAKSADPRTKARALALQALYEADVAGHSVSACFRWLKEEEELPEAAASYAMELVEGVGLRRDEIDGSIRKFAPAWPVIQLPVVDRNILRLAVYEILSDRGVPRKVAINEAVELAKTFGGESSPRFVNGVLGSFVGDMDVAPANLAKRTVAVRNNVGQIRE